MTLLDEVVVRTKGRGLSSEDVAAQRPNPRVAIRATALHTVFGDAEATWDALLAGRCIDDHAKIEGVAGPARAARLAERVARQAVTGGVDRDVAVVVGTSKGSVEDWLEGVVSPAGLADIAGRVADALHLRGPRLTVSAACASGLHALARGALMIESGEARQVLVVAAEASVHPLFVGSFQRLGVLAKPGEGCRPFDRNRTGFYMSEAAASVLLEAEDGGGGGRAGTVHVEGCALGGDATRLTGGDPQLRTLRHLLRHVIDGRPVDLVHAHGTGTPANDEAELAAIEAEVAGQPLPPVLYSHKGALGHSLGAAGLLSVVLNCRAHAAGVVPPNAQTLFPLATSAVSLSRDRMTRPITRSTAIAAGFGGATAAVALSSQ